MNHDVNTFSGDAGWIPWKLQEERDALLCQWLYLGEKFFTEPFFSDTVQHCRALAENRFPRRSELQKILEWSNTVEALEPTAFIFHVSRCGSTLVSQLLSLDPQNIVLSEVPFLDELLRLPYNRRFISRIENPGPYYKAALRFYGRPRTGREQRLFVKTDSWHLFFYRLIRRLYPNAVFLIVYRRPDEVIRSQKKLRGMQSVPGAIEPEVFGFSGQDISFDLDLYMSRVLEKYFITILEMMEHDPFTIVVNYADGIDSIMDRLMKITGMKPSNGLIQKMEERKLFHSKSPSEIFQQEPDTETSPGFLKNSFKLYEKIVTKQMAEARGE